MMQDFWRWYERHHTLNVAIAAALFALQLVHLVWLTGEPLAERVFGEPLFHLEAPLRWLIILVDYTEIPALISVSLIYINDLRKQGASLKPILYLLFLNSQLLHIFWITDEFVVSSGAGATSSLPVWLAYVAILIDYLELPVIYDTIRRAGRHASRRRPRGGPQPRGLVARPWRRDGAVGPAASASALPEAACGATHGDRGCAAAAGRRRRMCSAFQSRICKAHLTRPGR